MKNLTLVTPRLLQNINILLVCIAHNCIFCMHQDVDADDPTQPAARCDRYSNRYACDPNYLLRVQGPLETKLIELKEKFDQPNLSDNEIDRLSAELRTKKELFYLVCGLPGNSPIDNILEFTRAV